MAADRSLCDGNLVGSLWQDGMLWWAVLCIGIETDAVSDRNAGPD